METTDTPAISPCGTTRGGATRSGATLSGAARSGAKLSGAALGDPADAARLLDVPGVRNLRDAGGHATAGGGRVRAGLLFRSGSLGELRPEGAERLAALGLSTVVDLRGEPEVGCWPDLRHGLEYTLVRLPTLPPLPDASANPDSAADPAPVEEVTPEIAAARATAAADGVHFDGLDSMYVFMADVAGPPIVACLRRLLEPGALPALVHCAVGKDRTGITVAVLLDLLGVDRRTIDADYVLSNTGLGLLGEPVHYLDEFGVDRISRPVHPVLLSLFLDRVTSRHGSTAAFLRAHGLTEAELEQVRTLFTDPA